MPGIFPTWVRTIGRGLEYSLHGSTPLAEVWNIPWRCCRFRLHQVAGNRTLARDGVELGAGGG
eukprot:1193883-Prorocentrum_minimum.AAC.2